VYIEGAGAPPVRRVPLPSRPGARTPAAASGSSGRARRGGGARGSVGPAGREKRERKRGCGDASTRGVAVASEGRGRGATVRQGWGGVGC
jgi:hypothetical protein